MLSLLVLAIKSWFVISKIPHRGRRVKYCVFFSRLQIKSSDKFTTKVCSRCSDVVVASTMQFIRVQEAQSNLQSTLCLQNDINASVGKLRTWIPIWNRIYAINFFSTLNFDRSWRKAIHWLAKNDREVACKSVPSQNGRELIPVCAFS